jgi:hypothetical protein
MLTQYLGAAALGAFIKESVTEFANLDRQFSTLGEEIKRFGGTDQDLAKVKEQLHGLALDGGALLSETIPAMQKFVGITNGNLPAAMAAVKLASDAAETGQIQFGEALSGVAAIIQGRARIAANTFGIALRDVNGHVKSANQLLEESIKKYSDVSKGLDDTKEKLDKTTAAWEDFKQTVGKGFSIFAGWGQTFLGWITEGAKDLGSRLGFLFNAAMDFGRNIGPILKAAFDFKKLVSDPSAYGAELNAAVDKLHRDLAISQDTFDEQRAENHKKVAAKELTDAKGQADLLKQAKLAALEEEQKAEEEASKKRLELEHKTTQDMLHAQIDAAAEGSVERLSLEMALLADEEKAAVESAARADVNVNKIHAAFAVQRAAKEKQFATARKAAEKELADRLIQIEIEGAADGSEQKFILETDAINRRYLAEIESAERAGRETTQIKMAWQRELSNKTLAFIAARAQAEIQAQQGVIDSEREMRDAAFEYQLVGLHENTTQSYTIQKASIDAHFQDVEDDLNRQLDVTRLAFATGAQDQIAEQTKLQNKLIANEAAHAAATKRLELSVKQYKEEMWLAAASTAIGALQQAFGQNKAFALAGAIIDTAAGVTRALKDFPAPYSYVVAAAIGVAGAIQIAKIMTANPGGGGGGGMPAAPPAVGGEGAGASTAPTKGHIAAADGAIVPNTPGKMPPGMDPSGTDTVPAMLTPGEIIADAASSKDVLSGKAVIASGSEKGTPDAPAKPIVGGKLSLVPVKKGGKSGGPGALPGSRSSILDDPAKPISEKKGVKVPIHAQSGAVVPSDSDSGTPPSGGIKDAIARAGAWFKTALQPVPDAAPPKATVQLGGAKGSSALMPQLGGAMGGAVKAAMQPASDPGFSKVIDKLDELKPKENASAQSSEIDQSMHIHGNVYGGDEGMRQLSREVDRARRLDSNRIIR